MYQEEERLDSKCEEVPAMTRRYSERIAVNGRAIFTMGSMVGEGEVVDLSNPGCLIESKASVNKGESLHLKIFLRGPKAPGLTIALAVVRWTNGSRFGVEFIKMTEVDRAQLTSFVTEYLETFGVLKKDRRQGHDRRQSSAQGSRRNSHE
jgi:PilZ domain